MRLPSLKVIDTISATPLSCHVVFHCSNMPADGLWEKREKFVPSVVVLLSEEIKNQAARILEATDLNGAQPPSPDHRLARPVKSNESPRYVKLDQLDDFKSSSKQSTNTNGKDRGIVHKEVQGLGKVGCCGTFGTAYAVCCSVLCEGTHQFW